jgi:hypothetical protein
MFKGMPKIFWIGMLIMYGWCFFFMFLEMTVPGLPLKKFLGIPACYIYNWVLGLWVVNIVVSYLYFSMEEKREAAKQNRLATK